MPIVHYFGLNIFLKGLKPFQFILLISYRLKLNILTVIPEQTMYISRSDCLLNQSDLVLHRLPKESTPSPSSKSKIIELGIQSFRAGKKVWLNILFGYKTGFHPHSK